MGCESLAAQAIPTRLVLQSLNGIASASAAHVELDDFRCRWMPKPIFDELSPSAAKALAGNGMHLAVAGSVMGWTLAHAVPSSSCRIRRGVHVPAAVKTLQAVATTSSISAVSSSNCGGPSLAFDVGCRFFKR
jgi:hypothetical protein